MGRPGPRPTLELKLHGAQPAAAVHDDDVASSWKNQSVGVAICSVANTYSAPLAARLTRDCHVRGVRGRVPSQTVNWRVLVLMVAVAVGRR